MSRTVSFLITGLGRGGAETQLVRVGTELVRRGWKVRVVTLTDPSGSLFVGRLQAVGIEVDSICMAGSKEIYKVTKLARLLRRHRPDVLCSFLFHSNVIAPALAKLSGIPRVVLSIRSEHFGGGEKRLKAAKLFFGSADAVTINSEATAESMISRGVVDRGKLRVIPNAIDVSEFEVDGQAAESLRQTIGGDNFLFLAVGRMDPLKDYPTAINALAKVDGVDLVIAGKKDQESELRTLADRLGIGERVTFLGLRDDVPVLLAACDSLLLSSTTEGMPNAVLEAHAAGKPVVATNVGGVPEIILPTSGFTCPPSDVNSLAAAMQQMVDASQNDRAAMGAAGRDHVENKFGVTAIVNLWEDVLAG